MGKSNGRYMRGILWALGSVWGEWRRASTQLARIEATRAYMKGIQAVRMSVLLVLYLFVMAGLCLGVLAMLHVVVLAWTPEAYWRTALTVLFLADLVLVLVLARQGLSERKWMQYSQAYEMLRHTARASREPVATHQ